jgi:hypothetical protein
MIERDIGIDNRRFVNNVQARRGQTRKGVICLLHVKVMLASSGVLAFASAFEVRRSSMRQDSVIEDTSTTLNTLRRVALSLTLLA